MIAKIQSLARAYYQLTGFHMREGYLMNCQAREWLLLGFTEDDLKLVVAHIRKKVESERIRAAMLRWSFLIGNPVRFDEELQEARAVKRNAKPAKTNRERVLEVTGRVEPESGNNFGVKTPAQVMSAAGKKAFEEFKALRRQLET